MIFDCCFEITVGHEGRELDLNRQDRGNWTGGAVGSGELRGSRFGVSAAAYPAIDISSLTLDDARAIYRRDYWAPAGCDALPAPLALLVFDAAVNNGTGRAKTWLREALATVQARIGVAADGAFGPMTAAALAAHPGSGADLCAEYLARRVAFMGGLSTWSLFGLGWSRRLCKLPFEAMNLATVKDGTK